METLLEILLWPLGDLVVGIASGLFQESDPRPRTEISRGPCAYCRKRGGRFVKCRTCAAPHHRDCATLNRRCAVYGCGNRKFLAPAA